MYRVCGLQLGTNIEDQSVADKKFCTHLRFLPKNIYGHTAAVAPIIRLWSIVQILIVKYKVKPLNRNHRSSNVDCNKTNVFSLAGNRVLFINC